MAGIATLQDTNPLRSGWGEASACQCVPRNYVAGPAVGVGCSKDTECKGDRICRAAQCVDPGEAPLPVPPTPGSAVASAPPPLDGEQDRLRVDGKTPDAAAMARLSDWEGMRVVVTLSSGESVTGTLYDAEEAQLILRLPSANPGLRTTRSVPYGDLRLVERL
ncbi:MAG: hypothetical protein IV100_10600 [Myxococcales bacterium]|nr:hypothetical protein [Myxococcales bacterium]